MYAVDKGGTSPWLRGRSLKHWSLLCDYLNDVVQFVTRDLGPDSEAVFNRVVKHIVEACIEQLQTIRPETVGRMEEDENALRECFEDLRRVTGWISDCRGWQTFAIWQQQMMLSLSCSPTALLCSPCRSWESNPRSLCSAAREDIPRSARSSRGMS